ncbi:Transcriptional regulatory protein MucR homolog [uncultured Gammaproteobacteria bacterium]
MTQASESGRLGPTAALVAAYLGGNTVLPADLPRLIATVHGALLRSRSGEPASEPAIPAQEPAVPVRKSVRADSIQCLECGKSLKMLKRHLRTDHSLSPDAYRAKWSLPAEYPMVAPAYAKTRSEFAVKIGLGRGKRRARYQS